MKNRVYGPQGWSRSDSKTRRRVANSFLAPTSLTNGPPFLELQGDWILSVVEQQIKDGLATVEANKEAEEAWREHCLDLASKTLLIKTNSWYMGAKCVQPCH